MESMRLRFIGANGSMGLTNGEVYDVQIRSKSNYIWVMIPNFEFREKTFGIWKCPYSTPENFATNWEKADTVHRRNYCQKGRTGDGITHCPKCGHHVNIQSGETTGYCPLCDKEV